MISGIGTDIVRIARMQAALGRRGDALAQRLLAPVELPVGILTASLGGPFFLVLLLSRRIRHA